MTAEEIDKALQQFSIEINGGVPVTVPFRPEAWARHDYCFVNVIRKVEESGGASCLGWQFMRLPVGSSPGALAAIHHAVWESPEKELIDITPLGRKGIALQTTTGMLFLPDETATVLKPLGYEVGVSRPSRFYAVGRTAKVKKIVEAARLRERQYWEEVSRQITSA